MLARLAPVPRVAARAAAGEKEEGRAEGIEAEVSEAAAGGARTEIISCRFPVA